MKKRDFSLDCIRVLAIFMIVVFHFAGTWGGDNERFLVYANGTWGSLGTALFFMLSGFLLRKHHSKITSISSFYKKRWLSIFPAFYIAFLAAYFFNVIRTGSFLYMEGTSPLTFLLTLLGFDNLAIWYGMSTYALVGEWFTGVIVILYVLFPLLNKLINAAKWSMSVILTIFYVIFIIYIKKDFLPEIPAEISIVTCGYIFWLGMLIAECEASIRKRYIAGIVSLAVTVFMLVSELPCELIFREHITALFLFVTLLVLLKDVKGAGGGGKVMAYLSGVSYSVYLTHHFIVNILSQLRSRVPFVDKRSAILIFCVYLVIVLTASMVLDLLTSKVLSIKKKNSFKKTSS